MNPVRHRLDNLLASMPLPGEGAAREGAFPSERDFQAELLDKTLSRLKHDPLGQLELNHLRPEFADCDVLRTPLPLEVGEPIDSTLAMNPNEAGNGSVAFSDVFDSDVDDFDPLRAPQKSGEHAPVRLVASAETAHGKRENSSVPAATSRRAQSLVYWVCGGVTTLAAAAALALYVGSPRENGPGALASKQDEIYPNVAAEQKTNPATPEAPIAVAAVEAAPPSPMQRGNAASPRSALEPLSPVATNGEIASGDVPFRSHGDSASQSVTSHNAVAHRLQPPMAQAARKPSAEAGYVEPDHEPVLVPAAGPSNLPDHPTMGAITAGIARQLGDAKRCIPAGSPSVQVRLVFGGSGKITRVVVGSGNSDPAARRCISTALGSAQVAPFARTEFDANITVSNP